MRLVRAIKAHRALMVAAECLALFVIDKSMSCKARVLQLRNELMYMKQQAPTAVCFTDLSACVRARG